MSDRHIADLPSSLRDNGTRLCLRATPRSYWRRDGSRELLARIGEASDADAWKDRKYFDGYRKWAGP